MELEMDKCHYCGSFTTNNEKNYYIRTIYGVTKSHLIRGMGYSYIKKKITIYRCVKCHNKHLKHLLYIDIPIFLILYTLFYWVFIHKYGNGVFHIMKLFIPLLPTLLIMLIVSYIVKSFISLISKTVKFEDDIEDFEEIKKHLELGWLLKKPSKGEIIRDKDLIKTGFEKD